MTQRVLYELISNNSRVILPEFGAFLVKDDGSNTFNPDSISFSPFLKYNDGMVEDYLCKTSRISKDEASAQLNSFINNLREKLSVDGVFPIEELGELRMNERGSIEFVSKGKVASALSPKKEEPKAPTKGEDTKSDSKTQKKEVKEQKQETAKEEKQPKAIKKDEPAPAKKMDAPKEQKPEPEPPKQPKDEDITKAKPEPAAKEMPPKAPESIKEKPKPHTATLTSSKPSPKAKSEPSDESDDSSGVGKAILVGLGIGLLVILSGVAIFYYLTRESAIPYDETYTLETPTDEEEIPTAEPEKTEVDEPKGRFDDDFDRMSREIDETVEEKPEPPPTPERTTPEPPPGSEHNATEEMPPVSPDGSFHVIVGSFRNLEYAEKFSQDMIRSGYNSSVITQPSGMHAVTLGSYETRQDAVKAMSLVKNQHPNVWLLSQ